jgi:uncharacterized protein CbrC (UPF0167 family)
MCIIWVQENWVIECGSFAAFREQARSLALSVVRSGNNEDR